MIYFLVIFTLAGLLVSLKITNKNILSPLVITNVVWLFCFCCYIIFGNNLPQPGRQFSTAIIIWLICYFIGYLASPTKFQRTVKDTENPVKANKLIMDLFFFISIFSIVFLIKFICSAIALGPTGDWATDLRIAALGHSRYFTKPYSGYYIIFWQVSYMLELYYISKKNCHRVVILAIILLTYAFVTMSKFSFLDLFIKTTCILLFSEKIKLKHIIYGFAILFFFFVVFQSIRTSKDTDKNDFIVTYLLSSICAFDTLEPSSALHFGENTLRMFYTIGYKLHLSTVEPVNILLPYITKPLLTNTYTGMYSFFVDFGYTGIVVSALFFGLFFGKLFRKTNNSAYFSLLYAYFCTTILWQYVGDIFFSYLPGHIEFAILLYIPFYFEKHHLTTIRSHD